MIRPIRPDKLVKAAITLARWGRSPAAGFITGAVIHPDDPAVVDDRGTLTWREIDERSNALANSFADAGIKEGDGVAIMCRNHRGFIEATVAIAKLGAHALYLNTAFAGPAAHRGRQAREAGGHRVRRGVHRPAVRRRRAAQALHRLARLRRPRRPHPRRADREGLRPRRPCRRTRSARRSSSPRAPPARPRAPTAARPTSMDPAVSLLSKIPMRSGETSHIAAPLFHSWGFAHFTIGMLLGTTFVITRKFDPEDCLAQIERHRVRAPRGGAGDDEADPRAGRGHAASKYDTSSLKVVAASGSALPGDLAERVDGRVRRHALQPLRLDRGGVGHDRHAGRHARRAGHRGQAAARHRAQALRRERQGGAARARPAASSWATRCCSRATPAAARRTPSTA